MLVCATIVPCCLIGLLVDDADRTMETVRKPFSAAKKLPSLGDLCLMSSEELAKEDIALINLRCAEGLPGSDDLDVSGCLQMLDQWAEHVEQETDKQIPQFYREPEKFDHSEAHFRMMALVTVVQQDFGVQYNPERAAEVSETNFDYTNSEDLFIHGLIDSDNGGTCVSMPVLYTAIARRLGYPVYLVQAKAHVFCRWDGRGESVNVEATNQGMNVYNDAHYREWPHRIVQAEIDRGFYLKSLDNAGSLAVFMGSRGNCFEDNKKLPDARVSYALAAKHAPTHPMYRGFLSRLVRPKTIRDYPQIVRQQQRLHQRSKNAFGIPVVNSAKPVITSFPFPNQAANPLGFGVGSQP